MNSASLYGWVFPNLLMPSYALASGRRFWREARRLERLQWATADELEARAARKLRRLVEHAVANVPYYRELFGEAGLSPSDIRSVGDLERVPLTTKVALRGRFSKGVTAANVPEKRWVKHSTSGSSGIPFQFYGDRAAIDSWLGSHLFFRTWTGVRLSDIRLCIGSPAQRTANVAHLPIVPNWIRELLAADRMVYRSASDLGCDELLAVIGQVARRGRYFISTFPSYATWIGGQLLERQVELAVYPEVVTTPSASLSPTSAAIIERAFRCRVVNHYSAWEAPHLAQTCPENPELLHVNTERAILRVVRQDGSSAAPGEQGRLILTSLFNYVMPFINYDIGDWAVAAEPCPCGRGLPTLRSIEGRTTEVVRTPRGRAISAVALSHAIAARDFEPYIWQYQVVQPDSERLVLKIVPTSRFSKATAAQLRSNLAAFLGHEMTIEVETVESIPAEPSAKRLVVKSHLTPN